MNPQDVQIPKGMVLLIQGTGATQKDRDADAIKKFCNITNFKEPDDVLNLGGQYEVRYRIATWRGEPKTVRRYFHSKTYADNFIDLLRECTGVVIEADPDFKVELMDPRVQGMRLVNSVGAIEASVRGVVR